ncbi:hypothetical protein [Paenibacillus amylolyticus]|uniref:hypothetical protein n=1 Tax=Paenibacillus amylolyticus TaxID=1451 RepID=UPI00339A3E1B
MKKVSQIIIKIMKVLTDWFANPMISGAVITLCIFYLTEKEWILYIYSLIYLICMVKELKGDVPKRKLIFVALFILLLFPSIIKIPILALILSVHIMFKFENLMKRISYLLEDSFKLSTSLINLYLQVAFFMIYLLFMIQIIAPTINIYYFGYLENYKTLIDNYFTVYFVFLMSIFVGWIIISLCFSLIKTALLIEAEKVKIQEIIMSYVGILLTFYIVPDFMFSILYSYSYSLLQSEVGIKEMFKFSFSLHHQIALSTALLKYQDAIMQNSLLSIVEYTHVISNKIIEVTILSTIIISTFSDKVREYIKKEHYKK